MFKYNMLVGAGILENCSKVFLILCSSLSIALSMLTLISIPGKGSRFSFGFAWEASYCIFLEGAPGSVVAHEDLLAILSPNNYLDHSNV